MTFLESRRELIALRSTDEVLAEWKLTWRSKRCFHCGEGFTIDDESWFWVGSTDQIHMHTRCFLDWLPRLARDVKGACEKVADQ